MIQTHFQSPIGELLVMASKDERTSVTLRKEILEVVKLVTDQLNNPSGRVTYTESLFKLRILFINELHTNSSFNKFVEEVQEMYFIERIHALSGSVIGRTLLDCVNLYLEMFSKTISELDHSDKAPETLPEDVSLNDLVKVMLTSLPPQFSGFVLSSLEFDFYTIAAELILAGHVRLPLDQQEVIRKQLRRSCEQYAMYAHFAGFWTPADNDERQLIRNIKILIAARSGMNQAESTHQLIMQLGLRSVA